VIFIDPRAETTNILVRHPVFTRRCTVVCTTVTDNGLTLYRCLQTPSSIIGSTNICIVSSDTAIAIGFSILSAVISLVGVVIGYLTLRAMNLEGGTFFSTLWTTLQTHGILADFILDIAAADHRNLGFPNVLRHEHTYFIAENTPPRELEDQAGVLEQYE